VPLALKFIDTRLSKVRDDRPVPEVSLNSRTFSHVPSSFYPPNLTSAHNGGGSVGKGHSIVDIQ
jgi:hypothetical protein